MISKENVLVKSRQMGMSSLQIAYWQDEDSLIQEKSKRYNREEIAKEMDPVLRLMKKIGYEV